MKMILKIKVIMLTFFVVASSSYGASFDCSKAGTFIEISICDNDTLSKLDEELAKVYRKAKKSTNIKALKKEQRKWVKQKRNSCQNVPCLTVRYRMRINALKNYYRVSLTPNWSGTYSQESAQISIADDLSFTYNSVGDQASTCQVEGTFSQRINTLVYKNIDDYADCALSVNLLNNYEIKLVVDGCFSMCGAQASMIEGVFKK